MPGSGLYETKHAAGTESQKGKQWSAAGTAAGGW